jgi:hypothetical protein
VLALGNDYVGRVRLSSAESVVRERSGDAGLLQGTCRFYLAHKLLSAATYVSCFIAVFVALPPVTAMLFCDVRATPASSPRAAGLSVTKGLHDSIDHSYESEPIYDKASTRAAHLAA